MVSRVDVLIDSLSDVEVFFMQYSRIRACEKTIFIIEGKDDPKFYMSKISIFFGKLWDTVSVGGKAKVLELRDAIRDSSAYRNDKVFFMVDKDFDVKVLEADVYTTPTYSIENLYCDSSTIKNLVISECGLSDYKIDRRLDIINYIVQEYERLQTEFHKNKRLISANSIFLYVRKEILNNRISLNKILKIDVKIIDGNLVVQLVKKNKYISERSLHRLQFKEFHRTSQELKTTLGMPGMLFRGKQEILFLREFVNLLKEDGFISKSIYSKFGFKIKLEDPSMADHILSSAAQYVSTPDCLVDFLSRCKVSACANGVTS